jgi:hypothetical protein
MSESLQAQHITPVVIRSEDDAWRILEEIIDGSDEFDESPSIEFEGWPSIKMRLSTGNSSLTTPVMQIFIDFQIAIWRSYALLAYGEANVAKLTDQEKESLKFVVSVGGGSTDTDTDIKDAIKKLFEAAATKMTGKHIVIVAVTAALIYGGTVTTKEYFQYKKEVRQQEIVSKEKQEWLETQRFVSEHETARLKILQEAFSRSELARNIDDIAENARRTFLSNVPRDADIVFQGVEISGELANELAKNSRSVSREEDMEDDFVVLTVDARSRDGFRVWLRNVNTREEFPAIITYGTGATTVVDRIKTATFEKTDVHLVIKASRRAGKIVSAVIQKDELDPWSTDVHRIKK